MIIKSKHLLEIGLNFKYPKQIAVVKKLNNTTIISKKDFDMYYANHILHFEMTEDEYILTDKSVKKCNMHYGISKSRSATPKYKPYTGNNYRKSSSQILYLTGIDMGGHNHTAYLTTNIPHTPYL